MQRRYTQLDFAPHSVKRPRLVQQAGFLLRELVAGRVHPFPCDCGACIYWAYRHGRMAEGRAFSKRTFFIYFLRADMLTKVLFEAGPPKYAALRYAIKGSREWERAHDRWGKLRIRGHIPMPKSSIMLYLEQLRARARVEVLAILRELSVGSRNEKARGFLNGILRAKCFYTYYGRAGDPELASTVEEIKKAMSAGALINARPRRHAGS